MMKGIEIDDIVRWYRRERQSQGSASQAQELYFQFHPRTAFLKTTPTAGVVADIGAGDGSLVVLRDWPAPVRRDLLLHAYSIEKGERFDQFESYELSDWNSAPPEFDAIAFDAIICAHFIEHVDDPTTLIDWVARKLRDSGRAYVEWPSEHALDLPSREVLLDAGVDLVISRFDDDATHQVLPDRAEILRRCVSSGLTCVTEGIVRLPWLEEELMAHFRDASDRFPSQAAFWSWTGWSQYVVVEKRA